MAAERYVPKRIAEIDPRSDRRICVVGTVKEVKPDGNFVISDGESETEIINDNKASYVKPDGRLRVFATNYEGKFKAEIVQDMKNADLAIYNRLLGLSKKTGLQ